MKSIFLLTVCIFVSIQSFCQWSPYGSPLFGDSSEWSYGADANLNPDGNVIAIGISLYSDELEERGCVKVYEKVGDEWNQKGSAIKGLVANESLGCSVDINSSGNIVIASAPGSYGSGLPGKARVFKFNGTDWVQLGNELSGIDETEEFGEVVCINNEGNIIDAGASKKGYSFTGGVVKVFQLVGEYWEQMGSAFYGNETQALGSSICFNGSGNTLAIGSFLYYPGIKSTQGLVNVFEFDGTEWNQLGDSLVGDAAYILFGKSIYLNDAGNILAVGSQYKVDSLKGMVKVYNLIDNIWTQMGGEIIGDGYRHSLGYGLSLNSGGNILAVGTFAVFPDTIGYVKVFEYEDGFWDQKSNTLFGNIIGDGFGCVVSLDSTGTFLAVSAIRDSTNGINSGAVYFYQYGTGVNEVFFDKELSIYPVPARDIVTIRASGMQKVEIIDLSGKIRYVHAIRGNYNDMINLNLGSLESGMYFAKIKTANDVLIGKIIME